jgi:hypothetical protein
MILSHRKKNSNLNVYSSINPHKDSNMNANILKQGNTQDLEKWNPELPAFIKLQLDTLANDYNCLPIARMIHNEYEIKLNQILKRYQAPKVDRQSGNQQSGNQQSSSQQGGDQQSSSQQGGDQQSSSQQGGDQQSSSQQSSGQQGGDQQGGDQQGGDQQGGDQQSSGQQGGNQQNGSQQGNSVSNPNGGWSNSSNANSDHVFSSIDEILNARNLSQRVGSQSLQNLKDKLLEKKKDLSEFKNDDRLFNDLKLNIPNRDQDEESSLNDDQKDNEDSFDDRQSKKIEAILEKHKREFIEQEFRNLNNDIDSKMTQFSQMDENNLFDIIPESIKRKLWNIPKLLGVCVDILDGAKRGLPQSFLNRDTISTKGKLKSVRWGKFVSDLEINPTETMMNAIENKAPVYRSKQNKGSGDFILAVDVSSSMESYFDVKNKISTIDIAIAVASILYSFKKTDVVLWGSCGIPIGGDLERLNYFNGFHSETLISSCYDGLVKLFDEVKIERGTDLVIITDGEPSYDNTDSCLAIKNLIEDNGGIVWLIDFHVNSNRRGLHPSWFHLQDTYLPCRDMNDLSTLSLIMRNSLKKRK